MKASIKNQPKASKGVRYKVEVCCAAWIDLQGYGSMLESVGFDPTSSLAQEAIERLDQFHEQLYGAANKRCTVLIINDGAVLCGDLSKRSASPTYDFISRVFSLHQEINKAEASRGFAGSRCILAAGFRVRRKNTGKEALINGYGNHLVEGAKAGSIPVNQAITSALMLKPFVAAMPEAQANFAFSKAYLADSGGKKAGFLSNGFYLDSALLKSIPAWLSVGSEVQWQSHGMSATFYEINEIDGAVAGRSRYVEVCDANDAARRLTNSEEILARLGEGRIRSFR